MRRIIVFLCFVSLVTSAWATTFTANLKTLTGGTAKVFVRLKVMNCDTFYPRVSGSNVIVSEGAGGFFVDLFPDVNGQITVNVPDQESISCGVNTGGGRFYYRVSLYTGDQQNYSRRALIRENDYDVTGSSFNLNSATPKNVVGVNTPDLTAPLDANGFVPTQYLGTGAQGFGLLCLLDNYTFGPCGTGTGGSSLQIRGNGTNLPPRPFLNFGSEFTVSDNSSTTATDVVVNSILGSKVSGNIAGNAANVTGTIAIANGGTGATAKEAGLNALLPTQTGQSGKFLTTNGTTHSWAAVAGSGTVTSIGLTAPAELSVSTSPITTNGTFALTWANQTAGKVFASPAGSTGAPSFRALTEGDLPSSIDGQRITGNIAGNAAGLTGTLGFANGGTNATTAAAAIAGLLPATAGNSGKYLTNNGSGVFTWGSPSAYAAITENGSDVTSTKKFRAPSFETTDTVNNGQFNYTAGSGADATCATPAAGKVIGCYRNNQLELSNNGDAYSKVLRTADSTASNVAIRKGGTLIGTRPAVNFIEGSNVTLTVADDAGNNRVNVTVASSGSGGGSNVLFKQTSVQAGDTRTTNGDFATTYDITANSLAAGDVLQIDVMGVASNSSGANVTNDFVVGFGATDLWTSSDSGCPAALTTGQTNRPWRVQVIATVISIGASGTLEVYAEGKCPSTQSASNPFNVTTNATVVTVDTTATQAINAGTFLGAGATSPVTMRQMIVRKN
jgi:hypothetical protein